MNENAINEWNIKIWCLKQRKYIKKRKTYWNKMIYFIEIYNFKNS